MAEHRRSQQNARRAGFRRRLQGNRKVQLDARIQLLQGRGSVSHLCRRSPRKDPRTDAAVFTPISATSGVAGRGGRNPEYRRRRHARLFASGVAEGCQNAGGYLRRRMGRLQGRISVQTAVSCFCVLFCCFKQKKKKGARREEKKEVRKIRNRLVAGKL